MVTCGGKGEQFCEFSRSNNLQREERKVIKQIQSFLELEQDYKIAWQAIIRCGRVRISRTFGFGCCGNAELLVDTSRRRDL